ncbi:probable mitochondrial import inner membrane translocase subunit Tim17 1 [Drosophila obscura]|uniref:probable mitochondrial import inner membrane translocase subunit Tim17 1 n=1 Tax=Drosophila obscura TaxID=7282 RepID=UPI000BA0C64D|nr:probable mitochondrial import inner membrane translocase subunit Tim17 1 [Drosophila obscura]
MEREPCPFRLLEDCGGAFVMGALGGGAFQAIKGFRNAPSGLSNRLAGGMAAVRARSGLVGGNFALYGAIFSSIDCALVYCRKREDAWNSVTSGAATGGILAARQGLKGMMSSALICGVLMGLIEGTSILMAHQSADQLRQFTSPDRTNEIPQQKKNFSNLYTNFTEANPSSI